MGYTTATMIRFARGVIPGIAFLLLIASAAFAGGRAEVPVSVSDVWARETPGDSTTSAAYFVIENPRTEPDSLLEASTAVAGRVELHTMERQGDVMRMRRVFAIDVPAGGTAVLEPGGLHVMLMELQRPLAAGDRFPLTLLFAEAGEVTVDVEVRPLRATASGGMGH